MSAPLKGLSRLAQLNEADPLLASILTNFIVEQDRITLRPGYFQMGAIAAGTPISTLIPYYGASPTFVAAAGDGLYNASGTRIGTHSYGSDVWQWTSFANLSQQKFTVMVNGIDGIMSWDGTTTSLPAMDERPGPGTRTISRVFPTSIRRVLRISSRTPRRCRPVSIRRNSTRCCRT